MTAWILQSGPLGLAVLGLGGLGVVWAAVGTARPVRWWVDVWLAFCCALTNLGVMGATMGLIVGFSAVARAPAAQKAAVLSHALDVAMRPAWLALVAMVVLTGVAAAAHRLRSVPDRFDPRPETWGSRLLGIAGLVAGVTVPALGLSSLWALYLLSVPAPSTVSTLLYVTAAASLLSMLGLLVYVPFRFVVGWRG